MGDGSTLCLVNKNDNPSGDAVYTGDYYSDSKESHNKARVYWDETSSNNDYRNRIVELMMGDGLIYKFKEYKRNFNDIDTNESNTWNRPQMLLLEQVFDMFGHSINVVYGWPALKQYGRPLVQAIGVTNQNIDFEYANYFGQCLGFFLKNYAIGNYKFRFNEGISFDGPGNKLASLQEVVNPVNQSAVILYDNDYQRSYKNLPVYSGNNCNLYFGNMNRISSFTNFMGGIRKYKYFGSNQATIDYSEAMASFGTIRSGGDNFKGSGRDAFFTNMLDTLAVYDKELKQKSKQSFGYGYTDNGVPFKDKEADSTDEYTTSRNIISREGKTVNNSENTTTLKRYRFYPVKNYGTFNVEVTDLGAVNKLVKDSVFNSSGNYQTSTYIYDIGSYINQTYFTGSFLLLTKADTLNGIEKLTNYMYKFKDSTAADNQFDSLVTQKVEVDPDGYKTLTVFKNFDETVDFFRGWPMLGSYHYRNTTPPPDTISILGQKTFFKTGLPVLVQRFSNTQNRFNYPSGSDLLLKQQVNEFITTQNNNAGYIGGLISSKEYAEGSITNYIETKYEYYKKDTTGRALYSDAHFPYVEGNLKKTIFPDNKEEKYYYYLVTKVDTAGDYDAPQGEPPSPKVYYKVKYSDGSEQLAWETFQDTRLPVKTESYKVNSSSRDTLKIIYADYNAMGNPTMMVNENGYLTSFDYDNTYNRIRKITLPGDYSPLLDKDTMWIEARYYNTPVTINASAVGYYNMDPTINSIYYTKPAITNCFGNFTFKYNLQNNSPNKLFPAIETKVPYFDEYTHIDSAFLRISPQWYTLRSGGHTVQSGYEFTIKPISSSGNYNNDNCFQVAAPIVESQYTDAHFSSSLFRNYNNDSNRTFENPVNDTVRVESILNSLITANKTLIGFKIDYRITNQGLNEAQDIEVRMPFTECSNLDINEWLDNYLPKLTIYGQRVDYDTIYTKIFHGGTFIYEYDDLNRTATVKSRFSHLSNITNFKKVQYHFDGFGNIERKDLYTGSTSFDSLLYRFNFLNKPARNYDGTGDTTMFSYDFAGRPVKTKNSDTSSSAISYSYQSGISGHLAGYTGFVEKQTFTDETGRSFNKYFDAVGNLLREEKFVAGDGNGNVQELDNPFDPDTTILGDTPPQQVSLITDYQYDNLYRLIKVRTPEGKIINYWYDGYGRQMQRNTPDAGLTKYSYDKNGNLVLSQDANQYNTAYNLFTGRTYDGLNRLLTIGDVKDGNIAPPGGTGFGGGDTTLPEAFDFPQGADSLYIINVYDTISTAVVQGVFTEQPTGYSQRNYTRGRLAATAFRTNLGEAWSFKYYRYDERGNIAKYWVKLEGLGWKEMTNTFNSQNMTTKFWFQPNQSDGKVFTYSYDDAGRLSSADLYIGSNPILPEEQNDYPGNYLNLVSYTYNPDQQVSQYKLNNDVNLAYNFTYNNRNWITRHNRQGGNAVLFYDLAYNKNGNIRFQIMAGSYKVGFGDTDPLRYTYTYDNSNRLVKADQDTLIPALSKYDLVMAYDKDGNIKTLKRYGATGNSIDNFSYEYYNGSNRLKNVSQSQADYTYDANGNLTSDDLNKNNQMKYDWRNLMTENTNVLSQITHRTQYWYDESGNRVRKLVQMWQPGGGGIEGGDGSGSWVTVRNTFYVRDAGGKEIALYSGTNLEQWNLYGNDQIGQIDSTGKRSFYLKDHLGTIRATIDSTNTVLSAEDVDAWGFTLENRSYQSEVARYKFTSKERDRDLESNYDYFGARYYNSRIGRWNGVEPLLDKYVGITPYCYSFCSPIALKDIDGKSPNDLKVHGSTDEKEIYFKMLQESAPNLNLNLNESGLISINNLNSNIINTHEGFIMSAIMNPEVITDIIINDDNLFTSQDGSKNYQTAGIYDGSYLDKNGTVHAQQFINFEYTNIYSELAEEPSSKSIAHETVEAYYGGSFFPNTTYSESFKQSHNFTLSILPDKNSVIIGQDKAKSALYYVREDDNSKFKKLYDTK